MQHLWGKRGASEDLVLGSRPGHGGRGSSEKGRADCWGSRSARHQGSREMGQAAGQDRGAVGGGARHFPAAPP